MSSVKTARAKRSFAVLGAALVAAWGFAASAAAQTIVFDNFSQNTPFGAPSNPPWNQRTVPTGSLNRVDNTGDPFNEGTNNYYRIRYGASDAGNGTLSIGMRDLAGSTSAVEVKFDFRDVTNDVNSTALQFYVGDGAGASNWDRWDFRANSIRNFNGTTLANYSANTEYTVRFIVNNNSVDAVSYDSGSVAAGKYDLWLGATLVIDDGTNILNSGIGNDVALQRFEFQLAKPTSGTREFYFDNISVTAVPEPSALALMLGGLGVVGMTLWRPRLLDGLRFAKKSRG